MNSFKIVINLNNIDDFFSEFSSNRLSSSLASYIISECAGKSFNSKVEIVIKHSFDLSIEEMSKLKNILIDNFSYELKELNLYLNAEHFKQFGLFCLGIIFIIFYYFIDLYVNAVLAEIMSITSWVFMWEAIYDICFVNSERKNNGKRLKQVIKADVAFERV